MRTGWTDSSESASVINTQ